MDMSGINEVLGLASTAVGVTGKATSTIATLKGLFEGNKAPDNTEATNLLNALATDLTTANIMNVQLSEALKALSQVLKEQDEFEIEIARYELIETSQGDVVYKLKDDMKNGQPIHHVCPVCMKRDKLISFVTGDQYYKTCQTDNSHGFKFVKRPTPTIPNVRRRF